MPDLASPTLSPAAALDVQASMLRVHNEAPMRLTRAALPGMLARRQGAIINVSSVSGFMHSPKAVMYCATKAFLTTFSECLHNALRATGVRVQALCPGYTHTGFHEVRDHMEMDVRVIPRLHVDGGLPCDGDLFEGIGPEPGGGGARCALQAGSVFQPVGIGLVSLNG